MSIVSNLSRLFFRFFLVRKGLIQSQKNSEWLDQQVEYYRLLDMVFVLLYVGMLQ